MCMSAHAPRERGELTAAAAADARWFSPGGREGVKGFFVGS